MLRRTRGALETAVGRHTWWWSFDAYSCMLYLLLQLCYVAVLMYLRMFAAAASCVIHAELLCCSAELLQPRVCMYAHSVSWASGCIGCPGITHTGNGFAAAVEAGALQQQLQLPLLCSLGRAVQLHK
jgi:hypothetical protein